MANVAPGTPAPSVPLVPAAPAPTDGAAPIAPVIAKRVVKTVYQTRAAGIPMTAKAQQQQQTHASRAAAAQAAADKAAAPAVAPGAPAPAKNDGAGASAAQAPPPANAGEAGTAAPSTTPDPPKEAPPAAEEAKKLAEGEYARRLAHLVREDAKIAVAKQELARERQKHAEAMQRVEVVERARTQGVTNKLQFLQQAFGWTAQQILDEIVTDGARTPEQRQNESAQQFQNRMAALEREVQESRSENQREQEAQQVRSYISGTLGPMIAGSPEYAIIQRAFGAEAGAQVYSVMAERYKRTRSVPEPQAILREVVAYLKSEAEKSAQLLSGASAPAAQPAAKKPEPPATQGSAPPTSGFAKRQRASASPYRSRPIV